MSDSRVEKLAVWFTRQHGTPDDHRELATQLVATFAAAGLLVIDPDDPETQARLIQEAHRAICEDSYEECVEWRGRCVKSVEAMLFALKASG